MITFSTHEVDGVLVITFEVQPDEGERQSSMREWLYQVIQTRQDGRFAIDLGALDYMPSTDIGFLISLKRRIDARKGRAVLFQVNAYVLDTLRLMRVDRLFEIAEDLRDALARLPGA